VALEMAPDQVNEGKGSWHWNDPLFDRWEIRVDIVNLKLLERRMAHLNFPFDPDDSP
jgi:hypothetical protein